MPTRCTRFQPRSGETAHASVPQGGLCFNDQGGLSPLAATGELADTGPGPPSGASKDSVEQGLSSPMRRPPSKSAPWKRQRQPARLVAPATSTCERGPFPATWGLAHSLSDCSDAPRGGQRPFPKLPCPPRGLGRSAFLPFLLCKDRKSLLPSPRNSDDKWW